MGLQLIISNRPTWAQYKKVYILDFILFEYMFFLNYNIYDVLSYIMYVLYFNDEFLLALKKYKIL